MEKRVIGWLDVADIGAAVGISDGKCVSTIRLALAAAKLGFPTSFLSTSVLMDESHMDKAFYQAHADMDRAESEVVVAEARAAGVRGSTAGRNSFSSSGSAR